MLINVEKQKSVRKYGGDFIKSSANTGDAKSRTGKHPKVFFIEEVLFYILTLSFLGALVFLLPG